MTTHRTVEASLTITREWHVTPYISRVRDVSLRVRATVSRDGQADRYDCSPVEVLQADPLLADTGNEELTRDEQARAEEALAEAYDVACGWPGWATYRAMQAALLGLEVGVVLPPRAMGTAGALLWEVADALGWGVLAGNFRSLTRERFALWAREVVRVVNNGKEEVAHG